MAVAKHDDKEIDAMYKLRRKLAARADSSGWNAITAWSDLEVLEAHLAEIDPDGDWRYEGNLYDGLDWNVNRP